MVESRLIGLVQGRFARVAERGVSKIVSQSDGLGEVFIKEQGACHGTGNLAHFEGMRQPCAVMIAFGCEEDLRFPLEPAKRFGVDDAVAVPLKGCPVVMLFLGILAAAGSAREGGVRTQDFALTRFELFAYRHVGRLLAFRETLGQFGGEARLEHFSRAALDVVFNAAELESPLLGVV